MLHTCTCTCSYTHTCSNIVESFLGLFIHVGRINFVELIMVYVYDLQVQQSVQSSSRKTAIELNSLCLHLHHNCIIMTHVFVYGCVRRSIILKYQHCDVKDVIFSLSWTKCQPHKV